MNKKHYGAAPYGSSPKPRGAVSATPTRFVSATRQSPEPASCLNDETFLRRGCRSLLPRDNDAGDDDHDDDDDDDASIPILFVCGSNSDNNTKPEH